MQGVYETVIDTEAFSRIAHTRDTGRAEDFLKTRDQREKNRKKRKRAKESRERRELKRPILSVLTWFLCPLTQRVSSFSSRAGSLRDFRFTSVCSASFCSQRSCLGCEGRPGAPPGASGPALEEAPRMRVAVADAELRAMAVVASTGPLRVFPLSS